MTLEEAIRIKLNLRKDNYPLAQADEITADILSIEALKFIKRLRIHDHEFTIIKLPCETK